MGCSGTVTFQVAVPFGHQYPIPVPHIMREENNPVVLLTNNQWHIVESSRQSRTGLCGKTIQNRQAHARLSNVGRENICPKCLKLWEDS